MNEKEKLVHEQLAKVTEELDFVRRRLAVMPQATLEARERDRRLAALERLDQRVMDEGYEEPVSGPKIEKATAENAELLARVPALERRRAELRIEVNDQFIPGLRATVEELEPKLEPARKKAEKTTQEYEAIRSDHATASSELEQREKDRAGAVAQLRHLDYSGEVG